MHKKYLTAAALICLFGLTACGGKSANEQAAADAQKINLNAEIPKMAGALARECSRDVVKMGCVTDKARGLIKSDSAFVETIADYSKKCLENYGAQLCAAGYSAFLADNVANKLATPVAEQATQILEERAAAERRALAAREQAAKAMAEEAARKSKAATEEAALKAASEAKAGEEKLKKAAGEAVKAVEAHSPAVKSPAKAAPAAPAAVSPKPGQSAE